MSLDLVITDLGREALVNATNSGTAAVTIATVGLSSTAHTASESDTALPGQFATVSTIGGSTVADDVIHLSIRDDDATRAYDLLSFALYLDDGTLFAIYGQDTAILTKTASSTALIALDVTFADVSAASITFGTTGFTDPLATTSTAGLVELATSTEAAAGSDATLAITPATLAAALITLLIARDGAGSGIDADLLDGQHGAYYADVAARLGYTPLDASTYTAANVLAKLLTLDGAGSTLDADLLDGQHGSYYADVAARLGFTPLNASTYTAANVLAKLLTVDGSGSTLDADLLDGQHGSYYTAIAARLGYTPLNAATYTAADVLAKLLTLDGSGSTLDADLWRGRTPDQLIAAYFSTGTTDAGRWWKRPDGAGGTVIRQQGSHSAVYAQGAVTLTFPTAFTSLDYDFQATAIIPGAGDYDNYIQELAGTRTLTGVTVYAQDPSNGGSNTLSGFRWSAEGY